MHNLYSPLEEVPTRLCMRLLCFTLTLFIYQCDANNDILSQMTFIAHSDVAEMISLGDAECSIGCTKILICKQYQSSVYRHVEDYVELRIAELIFL